MASSAHLVRRFFWSLWWSLSPLGPGAGEDDWARSHLNEGELALWGAMGRVDRRHAVRVARRVEADPRVGPDERQRLINAALLHDVGKIAAGLGTFGRAGATVVAAVADEDTLTAWSRRGGLRGRLGRHAHYPAIGADLLDEAGSARLTVSWAREHHAGPDGWTVPVEWAEVLAAADD